MIVKNQLANGNFEIFETSNYLISTLKELHPLILKVTVYSENGKVIKKLSRKFKWIYKHFIFPSKKVQDKLNKIIEQQAKQTEQIQPDNANQIES